MSTSYGLPVSFSLERAAAPYFGIKVCYHISLANWDISYSAPLNLLHIFANFWDLSLAILSDVHFWHSSIPGRYSYFYYGIESSCYFGSAFFTVFLLMWFVLLSLMIATSDWTLLLLDWRLKPLLSMHTLLPWNNHAVNKTRSWGQIVSKCWKMMQ